MSKQKKVKLTLKKARDIIIKEIRKQGHKLSYFTAKEITKAARELMNETR